MADQDRDAEPGPAAIETVLAETDDHIDLTIGSGEWQLANGRYVLEEDYHVSGEIWRVYKGDADPYPSKPHAHCIEGARRLVGCKLHLGSRQLFDGRKPLDRFLERKQFDRLIELIKPKFPGISLPLHVPRQ